MAGILLLPSRESAPPNSFLLPTGHLCSFLSRYLVEDDTRRLFVKVTTNEQRAGE